jgi:hypothetical protein
VVRILGADSIEISQKRPLHAWGGLFIFTLFKKQPSRRLGEPLDFRQDLAVRLVRLKLIAEHEHVSWSFNPQPNLIARDPDDGNHDRIPEADPLRLLSGQD